jgi:hypothetical protein
MLQIVFYGYHPLNARRIKEAIKEVEKNVEFVDCVATGGDSKPIVFIKLIRPFYFPKSKVRPLRKIIRGLLPGCYLENGRCKKKTVQTHLCLES